MLHNNNHAPAVTDFLLKRISEVNVTRQRNKLIIEVPEDTTPAERDALVNEALRLAAAGESYKLESIEPSK